MTTTAAATYCNSVQTKNSIIISLSGGDTSVITVTNDNPFYKKIKKLIDTGKYDKIPYMGDLANRVKISTDGRFYVVDGQVYLKSENPIPMPKALGDRVIKFVDADVDVTPLINFWTNLSKNPSEESKGHLFAFLEANHVPITEDGCFIGYKRITSDFKDIYTRTFDNSVGKEVKVDRKKVDPNPNNTCSTGLHVAAFNYAARVYSMNATDVLVEVKVNPEDVVTVPPDYSNQKMRVCRYTVVAINPFKEKDDIVYNQEIQADDTDYIENDLQNANDGDYVEEQDDTKETLVVAVKRNKDGRLPISKEILEHAGLYGQENISLTFDDYDGSLKIFESEDGEYNFGGYELRIPKKYVDKINKRRNSFSVESFGDGIIVVSL